MEEAEGLQSESCLSMVGGRGLEPLPPVCKAYCTVFKHPSLALKLFHMHPQLSMGVQKELEKIEKLSTTQARYVP